MMMKKSTSIKHKFMDFPEVEFLLVTYERRKDIRYWDDINKKYIAHTNNS